MKTLEDYNKAIKKAYDKYQDLLDAKNAYLKETNNKYINRCIKVEYGNDSFIMRVNDAKFGSDDSYHSFNGPRLKLNGTYYDANSTFYPSDWNDATITIISDDEYLELFRQTMIGIAMGLQ